MNTATVNPVSDVQQQETHVLNDETSATEVDSWDKVGEDNIEDLLYDAELMSGVEEAPVESGGALQVQADPLGIYKISLPPRKNKAAKQSTGSVDPSREDFDPTLFLATVHNMTTLLQLHKGRNNLSKLLEQRQEKQKEIVDEKFNRFVSCTETVINVFTLLRDGGEGLIGIRNLSETLQSVRKGNSTTFQHLLPRQQQIDSIKKVLTVLTRPKFRFIFELPREMMKDMGRKDYSKVVHHYKKVKIWLTDTKVSMFRKVLHQAEHIVNDLKSTLFQSLDSEGVPLDEQVKIIRLLVSLGSSGKEERDPAWHCITVRYSKICDILKNATEAREKSVTIVKKLCEIIKDYVPDFWMLAKAFYIGDYHTELRDEELAEIERRYPEEKFAKLMHDILDTFVVGVRRHFFGEEVVRQIAFANMTPQEKVPGKKLDIYTTRRQGKIETRMMKRATKTKNNSFDIEAWKYNDDALKTPMQRYKMPLVATPKVRNSSNVKNLEIDEEDDDKVKVQAVMECAKVLSSLNITYQFFGKVQELLDEITGAFLTSLLLWTYKEIKKLSQRETWEVADRALMVTSLPFQFSKIVKNTLSELRGAIEIDSEVTSEIMAKNVAECMKAFSDVLYYLAFGLSLDELSSANKTKKISKSNERLLLTLNNCSITRTKIIPDLLKRIQNVFKLSNTFTEQSIFMVMDQLETLIRQKYLKSKTTRLSALIKSGLLSEGFDWCRNQIYAGGIGDYVMDVLIELVFVHEELNRYNPSLVETILSLLLEHIYQAYIQWLSFIDNLSIYGVLQVGLELKFINKIVGNYKTPISDNLFVLLDQKYGFTTLFDRGEFSGHISVPQKKPLTQMERKEVKGMLESKVNASSLLFQCFQDEEEE